MLRVSSNQTISVCICTCGRPRLLSKLFESLDRLSEASDFKVKLVVVDNDPLGSAESVVQCTQHRWPVHYVIEPKPGIAAARNAALKCSASADWVAFVDDDEVVDAQWLTGLVETAAKFSADVVGGPVIPIFANSVPKWFIEGGFCQRPRFKTGQSPNWLGTGNVLIGSRVLAEIGGFDERFSLTGGEDTDFFLRMRQSGFKIAWCDEAIAHEHIGPERGNMRCQLWRAYHDASLWSSIERVHDPAFSTRASRALKGTVHALRGITTLLFALFAGKRYVTRALEQICEGVGMLGGLMNLISEPYRQTRSLLGEK
ncbi:MAG: glycosyl transferase family 2 [Candidatus Acidoferrum typicum]|nr:glycosyl transferase family 2 [Candidatus Acidoferrum typicum]